MSSVRVDECSSSFTFSSKHSTNPFKVQYKFDTGNQNDSNLLGEITKSNIFLDYLNLFTKPKALKLNSITFKQIKVDKNKKNISFTIMCEYNR